MHSPLQASSSPEHVAAALACAYLHCPAQSHGSTAEEQLCYAEPHKGFVCCADHKSSEKSDSLTDLPSPHWVHVQQCEAKP